MPRYVNADKIMQDIEKSMDTVTQNSDISNTTKEIYLLGMKHAMDYIEIAPTEVVNCGACIHYEKGICHNPHHRYAPVKEDHYCGYGIRRIEVVDNDLLPTK